jgi:hypothetical protein
MINLEDDPIIGSFFDTPEKKAKWIYRFKIATILWIIFVIIGISFIIWYALK